MNKQPPIELISRSDTDFYILLTDRETLQQWAQNGMAAVCRKAAFCQ